MANTQGIAKSFRVELLNGIHAFGTSVVRAGTGADAFKAALYLTTATIDATVAAYTATGEVSGTGYVAGGLTITNGNSPSNTGGTGIVAFWTPSANFVWAGATLSTAFDAVLVYNSTQGNKAVAVYTFGAQTITAGTFTLTMPTNDLNTGLLRIA